MDSLVSFRNPEFFSPPTLDPFAVSRVSPFDVISLICRDNQILTSRDAAFSRHRPPPAGKDECEPVPSASKGTASSSFSSVSSIAFLDSALPSATDPSTFFPYTFVSIDSSTSLAFFPTSFKDSKAPPTLLSAFGFYLLDDPSISSAAEMSSRVLFLEAG